MSDAITCYEIWKGTGFEDKDMKRAFERSVTSSEFIDLVEQNKMLSEIVEAVAHVGIDFGFGKFELDESHINKARSILEGG